jgi:23S rRNA (adenine2503-C2)-methyltransferase
MTLDELSTEFLKSGFKRYRAEQVFYRLSAGASCFDEMMNLPAEMRSELEKKYFILRAEIVKKIKSKDGTVKFLIKLSDGNCVESVLMKYKFGFSACVSTQAGCRMSCRFCASSSSVFVRNLAPSEITAQIECISKTENIKISNVTLMGVGEPFDNYKNVMNFIKIAISPKGINLGARRISVSTCGLADKIVDFANEKLGVNLSVSLHAPDNGIRNFIMPINRKFPIEAVLSACRFYLARTNRRISFEYILFNDINDSRDNASELAGLLKGLTAHVNLIRANEANNFGLKASSEKKMEIFAETLLKKGINVTTRRTLGADIKASCGQLRVQKGSFG